MAYRAAIRLDPRYAPAHCNLGVALRITGDPYGAVASLEKAVELDPNNQIAKRQLEQLKK